MRIGKFGFVNNFLPYYKLEKDSRYQIIESTPKKLVEMFEKSKIVYAPIPTFELIRKNYEPNRFCIASDGEVYSVVIISKRNRFDDSPVAITAQSMTSANMMRIIKEVKGLINELVILDCNVEEMLKNFEHALVIGDEAIKARMRYRVLMDVGEEWKEITGLPAVFGVAVSKVDGIDEEVIKSVNWGRRNIEEVVGVASQKFRLPEEFLYHYFSSLIHKLGKRERKSIEVFKEMCYEYRLL
ncbi:MAG: menaquinone biosynthesis protein [Archaeoglobaceae archaeon]|nr:menaquinone biosynthesis protein [Archaeoglobaceae archaeon]MDW7990313.1 menaquinone biosynthesis protein [Archaeoglobaceae archaeon]